MFKLACFLLRFAPLWYLQCILKLLPFRKRASWKDLSTLRIISALDAIVLVIAVISGLIPSLMFFNNVYYDNFPELRI